MFTPFTRSQPLYLSIYFNELEKNKAVKKAVNGCECRRSGRDGLAPVDAIYLVARLEEAGATLLALPSCGPTTALRTQQLEVVRDAMEAYGWTGERVRPATPSPQRVSRMDEALSWIALLDTVVERRIVGARALVDPMRDRHVFSWRRLGDLIGADHKTVQSWHSRAIDRLTARVNRKIASAHSPNLT